MAKSKVSRLASSAKRLQLENALLQKKLDLTAKTLHNSLGGFAAGLMGNNGLGASNMTSFNPTLENNQYAPITLFWTNLMYMYTTHGLLQTAVDMPVLDALRGGLEFSSDGQLSADDLQGLERWLGENDVLSRIGDAFIWARLFGGGALVINTEGDPEQPIGDEVLDGKIELYDASRWELTCERRIPASGKYGYYGKQLDASRVITILGKRAPWLVRAQLSDWGMSELQRAIEDFNMFLRTRNVLYEILDEAKVDVFSLKGFTSALATSTGTSLATRRIQTMNQIKNFNNALIMDKDDEYQQKQLSFAGIADIMRENRMGLASAFRMPMSKLFGIPSTGFSSGEDDIENYNGLVESEVREPMKHVVRKVLKLATRHLFGEEFDVDFKFRPLRILSATDEEAVRTSKSNRYLAMYDKSLMSSKEVGEAMQKDSLVPVPIAAERGLLDDHPAPANDQPLEDDSLNGPGQSQEAETAAETEQERPAGKGVDEAKPLPLPKSGGTGKPKKPEAPEKPEKPKLNRILNADLTAPRTLRFMGRSYPVSSVEQAQDTWGALRDEAMRQGLGSRDLAEDPVLFDGNGRRIGIITWNGSLRNGKGGPTEVVLVREIDVPGLPRTWGLIRVSDRRKEAGGFRSEAEAREWCPKWGCVIREAR